MELKACLDNLYLFVRAIDAGGFAAAARELGTTRALVSRHIIQLEQTLNTKLLYRDGRHFALTPVGEAVYRHAVLMCGEAQAALKAVEQSQEAEHSSLHLSMTDSLSSLMASLLVEYANQHPKTQIRTCIRSDIAALLQQHTDLILLQGEELPDSTEIVAHPLGHIRQVFVAHPTLLKQLGSPKHPQEVNINYCLVHSGHNQQQGWRLHDGSIELIRPRLLSDRVAPVIEAACAAMGVAQLPMHACHQQIDNGHLRLLFESLEPTPLPLHALTLARPDANSASKNFIHFMRERLHGMERLGLLPKKAV